MDWSGVKSGLDGIKRDVRDTALDVKLYAQQAADSVASIGADGDDAVLKVEIATSLLIRSIQRATAATKAGKGSPAKDVEAQGTGKGSPAKEVETQVTDKADWLKGARNALEKYQESASDVSKQTQEIFTKAFAGMEDAMFNFVTTGKLSFSSLVDSIIADIIRMQIRAALGGSNGILAPLFNAAVSLFGGGGNNPLYNLLPPGSVGGPSLSGGGGLGLRLPSVGSIGDSFQYATASIGLRSEDIVNAKSAPKVGLDYLGRLNGYANSGLVSPAPLAGVARVEIINNGAPAQVQSADLVQGPAAMVCCVW